MALGAHQTPNSTILRRPAFDMTRANPEPTDQRKHMVPLTDRKTPSLLLDMELLGHRTNIFPEPEYSTQH